MGSVFVTEPRSLPHERACERPHNSHQLRPTSSCRLAIDRARVSRAQPLYLQVQGRALSGICIAIARRVDVGVGLVRLAFVAATLIGAHALVAYVVLGFVIRWDPAQRSQLWSNRLWRRLHAAAAR